MFRPRSLAVAGLLSLLPAESLALARCDVTFAMTEAVAWGALRFTIDYPQPQVAFDGSGAAVECVGLGNAIASFEDDQAGTVLAAIVALDAASGPAELVRCAVTAASTPVPEDFTVTVLDGADSSLAPLHRLPAVAATSVDCSDRTDTAVLGDATPTTVMLAATSTTMPLGSVCTVDFRVSSAETLGALQFNTDYGAVAGGTFDGIGPAVVCNGLVADALHSFNDLDASQRLRTSIIKLNGFTGPSDLSTCFFLPAGTEPIPSDFVITVLDASTPTSEPVRPLPAVEISAVSCVGPTTTTSTTTTTDTTTTTSTTSTTVPVCGDAILQAGEQCDAGSGNSDVIPDACRSDCTLAGCGDGVTDSGEQCDAGAGNSDVIPDACRSDCTLAGCGDGVTDSGEQCDAGAGNSDVIPDACRSDCTLAGCGDGVTDSGEQCDTGASNSDVIPDACRTDCTLAGCGDGVTDSGEQCDAGAGNSDVIPDACRSDCTLAGCGDGVTDSGEQCDTGASNSDVIPDACRTDCTPADCGDGAIDTGEQCDDGAANSNADPEVCRRDCVAPYICGDADDDGQIAVSDAQRILVFAVGALDRCDLGRCDTTGDGRVTVSDAQRALFEAVALPVDLRCLLPVRVSLADVVMLGWLSLEVHYGATGSSFLGSGPSVACTGLLPNMAVTFDNDAANDTLRLTASSPAGIGGPVDVAECLFRERDDLPAADTFTPQATGATNLGGDPVSPPSVSLRF